MHFCFEEKKEPATNTKFTPGRLYILHDRSVRDGSSLKGMVFIAAIPPFDSDLEVLLVNLHDGNRWSNNNSQYRPEQWVDVTDEYCLARR